MSPFPLLLVFGLAAAGLAALVRTAPWPAAWKAKKPLSCPVCMGGHGAWLALLGAYVSGHWAPAGLFDLAVSYLAVTAVALFVLTQSGIFAADLFAPHEE